MAPEAEVPQAHGLRTTRLCRHAFSAALVAVAVAASCSPAPSPSVQSSPATLDPTPSSLGDTPPPLNATESRIIEGLDALGIAAMRAEYSFGDSAALWSRFDDGSELFVVANPVGSDGREFSVVTQSEIAGVTVERVEYVSGAVRDRFPCDDLMFEAEGAVPPGFDDFESFLARFIAVLDCRQGP